MADQKPVIVIKKITVVQGGGHGGAWKVAFADFMTAMMAFFLVMWLMSTTSQEQKKAISDYFSTPSVIEYQYQNMGAEMTLEKLFLDLVNQPLATLETMFSPMDKNPNILSMGVKKIVVAYMNDQLGGIANNVNVTPDSVVFDLPEDVLFSKGTANPSAQYISVMEKVKGVTTGIEDSNVTISTLVYNQSVQDGSPAIAKNVAEERLALIQAKVQGSLEHDSVDVRGRAINKSDDKGIKSGKPSAGLIRIEIKQKATLPDGTKPKPIQETIFGKAETNGNVYDNFVDQLAQGKHKDQGNNKAMSGADQIRAKFEAKLAAPKIESENVPKSKSNDDSGGDSAGEPSSERNGERSAGQNGEAAGPVRGAGTAKKSNGTRP